MATIKTYTVYKDTHYSHHRNHRLVKAAGEKGQTSIEITFVPHDLPSRGWWLKSKEIKRLFLGYHIDEAENRVNQIPAKVKPEPKNENATREKMHGPVINGLMCPITALPIY